MPRGDLEPKILVCDHDGVFAVCKPAPGPKCGKPCAPQKPNPCDLCCWLAAKHLLESISRYTTTTPEEARKEDSHELN